MNLLLITIALAVFATLGLIAVALFGDEKAVEARLVEVTSSPRERMPIGFRDILGYVSRLLMPIRQLLGQTGDEDLAYRLSVSGFREPGDADTFLNAKLLFPVLGVLLGTFTGRGNVLIASLMLGAAGFFAPDLFVLWAKKKRTMSIALSLPNAMDLLVMCMEAGLGLDQAMLRVAQVMHKAAPGLSEELELVSREQRAGRPRIEAWQNMAHRVDLDVLRQFTGMLAQTERMGTPISRSLSQFADNLRTKRLLEAEERAAKTSTKLVFPLVLFIFPALFIVILGPAAFIISETFK